MIIIMIITIFIQHSKRSITTIQLLTCSPVIPVFVNAQKGQLQSVSPRQRQVHQPRGGRGRPAGEDEEDSRGLLEKPVKDVVITVPAFFSFSVYDLGSGTFDVSLLEIDSSGYHPLPGNTC